MLLLHLVEDRRAHRRRRYRVYGDLRLGELLAERFRQPDHRRLGGAVGRGVGVALLAGDRGDVDDAAVILRQQIRHDGPVAVEEAVDVDIEYLSPLLDRILPERIVWAGDGGATDEDLDAAQELGGPLGRL